MPNNRFLNALQGKPQKIPPIWLMRQAGRYHSHYQNLKKNDATFKQCYSLLGNKGNMLMFSEGGHHDEYYLQTLSKGSSRLAYQAQMKYPKEKMTNVHFTPS